MHVDERVTYTSEILEGEAGPEFRVSPMTPPESVCRPVPVFLPAPPGYRSRRPREPCSVLRVQLCVANGVLVLAGGDRGVWLVATVSAFARRRS